MILLTLMKTIDSIETIITFGEKKNESVKRRTRLRMKTAADDREQRQRYTRQQCCFRCLLW